MARELMNLIIVIECYYYLQNNSWSSTTAAKTFLSPLLQETEN